MLLKSMTAGIVGTALLTSVAFAQTPSTTTTTTAASPAMASDSSSHKGEWRSSKLIGLNVYNDNNEKLGDINELLLDKSGKIQAVVIGVGGFLGMGEHDVAVAFDKVKFVNEPVASASNSSSSNSGPRPAGTASNAPMTTTGTSTPSGATTTTPTTTTGTGTGMSGSSNTASGNMSSSRANQWYPDHAMLSATKDQLKGMTQFKYSDSNSR